MQKIKYLIIALLCAVAQGAWAADYNVGTESELRGAISNGANIKLTADIALSNCLEIGDGGSSTPTVTIDLNGKTLSRSLEAADADGHVIWVRTGSKLTVTDGSGNNSGQITGGWASNGGGICNYGTLYFQGGTITSCQTDYTGGDPSNLYLGVKDGKSALFYPGVRTIYLCSKTTLTISRWIRHGFPLPMMRSLCSTIWRCSRTGSGL